MTAVKDELDDLEDEIILKIENVEADFDKLEKLFKEKTNKILNTLL
jgi:hypothetical protein